jgi:hypothetical protein
LVTGILAVWNECAPGEEAEYERWYIGEHLPERLSVPGFCKGWRYEALSGSPKYFTYYETDTSGVLASPAYMARLENPTPWTRRIMKGTFLSASRTVCDRTEVFGDMAGGHVVSVRWEGRAEPSAAKQLAQDLSTIVGVTKTQVWTSSLAQTPPTEEVRVRGGSDALIGGALIVDCVRAADAQAVSARLARGGDLKTLNLSQAPAGGVYTFLCLLEGKTTPRAAG